MTAPPWLAADPRLRHRDAMLDTGTAAVRLAQALGVPGPVRAERLRAKYRVGQSLRVLHRLHADGGVTLVSSRMAPPDRIARLARLAARASERHPRRVAYDAALDCVSWVFPTDRKIPALAALVEPGTVLSAVLGAKAFRSTLVAYAPEKSATARIERPDNVVIGYAKTYADADALSGAMSRIDAVDALRDSGLRIPGILGVVPESHLVVLEALPGTRLDALPPAELGPALERLAAALATLHTLSTAPGTAGRSSQPALERAASHVATARPDVAELVGRLLEALLQRPPYVGSTLLHGDVHLKNAVIDGSALGLLDLDQLTAGHPGADIGSLLAALRCAALTRSIATADAEILASRFLTAYRRLAPMDPEAVRWHTAAALLGERALRAVNRVLPRTLEVLPLLLDEALRLLSYDDDGVAGSLRTAVAR